VKKNLSCLIWLSALLPLVYAYVSFERLRKLRDAENWIRLIHEDVLSADNGLDEFLGDVPSGKIEWGRFEIPFAWWSGTTNDFGGRRYGALQKTLPHTRFVRVFKDVK
jgi:hypothetical protein